MSLLYIDRAEYRPISQYIFLYFRLSSSCFFLYVRLPSEFGVQRHAQVFTSCVLIMNSVMVDIDWLVLDTLVGEIDVH
jgi:hypothetical protein